LKKYLLNQTTKIQFKIGSLFQKSVKQLCNRNFMVHFEWRWSTTQAMQPKLIKVMKKNAKKHRTVIQNYDTFLICSQIRRNNHIRCIEQLPDNKNDLNMK
jgi:hypothetical protein